MQQEQAHQDPELTTILEGKRTQRPNLTQPSLEYQGVELDEWQFCLVFFISFKSGTKFS